MRRPSLHSNFFSSLKQVEKRLKSDEPSASAAARRQRSPSPIESKSSLAESLSTPMFIHFDQPNNNSSTLQDSSEPPSLFLSSSLPFTHSHQQAPDQSPTTSEPDSDPIDNIQLLIQLLGLSEESSRTKVGLGFESGYIGDYCNCEGGFYSKIAIFKGPKCRKEVQRLEGWIEHFMHIGEDENIEPLRLAHLLLGKAAFAAEGGEGLEFPSTLDEFLQSDPPSDQHT